MSGTIRDDQKPPIRRIRLYCRFRFSVVSNCSCWNLAYPGDTMVGGVRNHSKVTSPLNGCGQTSLVFRAYACLASGFDPKAIGKVAPEQVDSLIVDMVNLIDAEPANLTPCVITRSSTSLTTTAGSLTAAAWPLASAAARSWAAEGTWGAARSRCATHWWAWCASCWCWLSSCHRSSTFLVFSIFRVLCNFFKVTSLPWQFVGRVGGAF